MVDKKIKRFPLRLDLDSHSKIEKASKLKDVSINKFVKKASVKEANKVLSKNGK